MCHLANSLAISVTSFPPLPGRVQKQHLTALALSLWLFICYDIEEDIEDLEQRKL